MTEVPVIYSDGACSPNPGKGAWCCIIKWQGKELVLSDKDENTTNNRMEIMGLYKCLPLFGKFGFKKVKIRSDSMYLGNGLKWRGDKKFKLDRSDLPNKDLWIGIHSALDQFNIEVEFEWEKGHSGNTENERCDSIAQKLRSKI